MRHFINTSANLDPSDLKDCAPWVKRTLYYGESIELNNICQIRILYRTVVDRELCTAVFCLYLVIIIITINN